MAKKKTQNNLIYKILSCPKERISIFREISENNQGFVLLNLSKRLRQEIMSKLSDRELIELVDYLDPGKATDLYKTWMIKEEKNFWGN